MEPLCLMFSRIQMPQDINFLVFVIGRGPLLWSSGQEFLATDPEVRVRFQVLPEKKGSGLERGPLCLVSTTEELLDRKVAAPV
jgi:hypothetical protein